MRRDRAIFWGLALALVAVAAVAYLVLLGREPGAEPAPPPAPPAPLTLSVARLAGKVELVRGGVRAALAPGDALRAEDAVETGPEARVELSAGQSYSVVLEGGARFDVKEITATLSRFRLGAGLVSARVRDEPGRTLEIEAARDTVARTTGGEVFVARSGKVVAVGVTEGAAELRSGGSAVSLAKGQSSLALDGGSPSAPAPIPSSLLLKVSWPAERITNAPRIVVTGRTEPGAVVVLGGEPVQVAPDGTFTHVVYLREGRQALAAKALAVGGRSSRADGPPIVLDTRPPEARFDTRGLWGGARP